MGNADCSLEQRKYGGSATTGAPSDDWRTLCRPSPTRMDVVALRRCPPVNPQSSAWPRLDSGNLRVMPQALYSFPMKSLFRVAVAAWNGDS